MCHRSPPKLSPRESRLPYYEKPSPAGEGDRGAVQSATMIGRVLVVAVSDSGAGAGIQADIKTVAALGGYATTAITALTAQSTEGVAGILPVPADFVRAQMAAVLDDIGADTIKTGMLHNAGVIDAVAGVIE